MKTKFISLFLVFSLLALSGNLIAKEKRGAELIITKKDGQQVKGELIAVKQNSLLLLDTEGADVSVDISDITMVRIMKKSTWRRAIEGFLIVGGIGTLASVAVGATYAGGIDISSTENFMFMLKIFAFWGAIGALGSSMAGGYQTIQIEGKSPDEVKEALEKLRKKARIPDYK